MRLAMYQTAILLAILVAGALGQPTASTSAPATATAPALPAAPPATAPSSPATATASVPAVVSAPLAATAPTTASAPAPTPGPAPAPAPATAAATAAAPAPPTSPAPVPATAPVSAPSTASAPASTLAIHDGDIVVFLGDELTETPDARRANRPSFPQLVETFLTVRYPELHRNAPFDTSAPVRYVSVGWTGDTAARSRLRLERDVLSHKPTVVVVCLGMNDPGYLGFVPGRLERTRQDLTTIVRECQKAGARVWLMSPPCVEEERGKKARILRDGQGAVADLEVIRYNETLAKYTAAMREIAAANPPTGFADWFAASSAVRAQIQTWLGEGSLTVDGRAPSFHGTIVGAATLLKAWGAEPIRAGIELDWTEGTVRVSSHLEQRPTAVVQITDDGKRILSMEGLPLPWPLPGDAGGALQSQWKAAELCQIVLRIPNPPELGIVLVHEAVEQDSTVQRPITAVQLQAGFNLATAEPLRTLSGVRDLFNLVGTKNRTRDTIWRRLELSAPQPRELTEAHRKLIDAWKAYVDGYERMIQGYPKTFNARFVLTEAAESEILPTSQPARPPRGMPSPNNPAPATVPDSTGP